MSIRKSAVNTLYTAITAILLLATASFSLGSEHAEHASHAPEAHQAVGHESHGEEAFNPGETIMNHIADSHEWHLATLADGHNVSIFLPVILYSADRGLEIFSSSALAHGNTYNGYTMDHHGIKISSSEGRVFYDFSITKNVAQLFLTVLLLLGVFLTMAAKYKAGKNAVPRGIQSFFEPIIIFIRDDVAKQNIGPKYAKYVPYLLTVFFFIWFGNVLGLIPGSANLTGNIAVTLVMATFTLIVTVFSANKNYWHHIFATPGVPAWLLPIMIPVEIIGIFTKPVSLMIRLFANITGGHILILSLLSLVFIFKNLGVGVGGALFAVVMNMLEVFVAILQAYVFTLLTSMYIGSAVEEHHHDDHAHAEGHH